jgi:hypothetical protein
MTDTATEPVLIGARVRVTDVDSDWAANLLPTDVGEVINTNLYCCGGKHAYTVRTDDGREGYASKVEPVSNQQTETEPVADEGDERDQRIARLTEENAAYRADALRAQLALDAYKDRVREALIEEGERRDWCEELDEFLESLDLEPRSRSYDVSLTVSISVPVILSVTASNDEEAADVAADDEYAIGEQVSSALRYEGSQYVTDVTVDEVRPAD